MSFQLTRSDLRVISTLYGEEMIKKIKGYTITTNLISSIGNCNAISYKKKEDIYICYDKKIKSLTYLTNVQICEKIKLYGQNKITFKEYVDQKKLNIIIKNYNALSKHLNTLNTSTKTDQRLTKIINFNKNVQENENTVTYKTEIFKGRYTTDSPTYLYFPKQIKESLCSNDYIDIDIVNCHPTCLEQIISANNTRVILPLLKTYVTNRDKLIKSMILKEQKHDNVIDKSLVKLTIIKIINGGFAGKNEFVHQENLNFLEKFANEMRVARDEVVKYNKVEFMIYKYKFYKEYSEYKNKNKNSTSKLNMLYNKYNNAKKSFISYKMQQWEKLIVQTALIFYGIEENDFVTIFSDGFMIKNNYFDNPFKSRQVYLRDCESFIFRITGFDIKLIIKPMNDILF